MLIAMPPIVRVKGVALTRVPYHSTAPVVWAGARMGSSSVAAREAINEVRTILTGGLHGEEVDPLIGIERTIWHVFYNSRHHNDLNTRIESASTLLSQAEDRNCGKRNASCAKE